MEKNMILDKVLERGSLKVSVSSLDKKDNGEFSGFHVDLSRAIAAAIFGDANKVEFVVQNLNDSLNSVANAEVDLAATGVAINSGRDAGLNIDYGPVYLYDNQALLVRENSNIDNIFDLQNKKIGVVKDTTSEQNLSSYFKDEDISFSSQTFESTEEMLQAYDRGEIDAISSNRSILFSNLEKLKEPKQHKILDEELSKEPLALVIPENDSEWGDIVRWVTYALIQAFSR
jgi:ABC-type amino acid transport substrate-binding protein